MLFVRVVVSELMSRLKIIVLSAMLGLAACQSEPQDTIAITAHTSIADMELRATSDLLAPAPIVRATFVPNNVASWVGHIIMIDEKGDILRATTESKVTPITTGDFDDVIGLNRPNKAGAFFALTKDGELRAFIEADNDGNFKPITTSQTELPIAQFCQSAVAYEEVVWTLSDKGKPVAYSIEFFDESSVSLTQLANKDSGGACEPLTVEAGGPALSIQAGSSYLSIGDMDAEMINGLSIAGLKTPRFATITNENMGSVFADGLLLVADKETGRLVLIARGYLLSALKEAHN